MGMSAKKLASAFIGEAMKAQPSSRTRILRKAANVFAHAASDPRNERLRPQLTSIGLEFADAAQQSATTSDFTQLLRDTAQAWEQLGPDAEFSMHASQDAMAMQRGVSAANDPGQTSRVSIAPMSFSSDATLGRATTVTFAPTPDQISQGIQQSQTVAFWQGQKQEAQAMSIDINLVLPPRPTFVQGLLNPRDARAFATIQYGSDGNTGNHATIDVGLGRRVNVLGNYISVLVGMDPPGPGAVSAVLTLGASIAAFASPSEAPVTRTVYFDALDQDAFSDLLPIPQRAVCMLAPLVGDATTGAPVPGGTLSINFFGYDAQQIVQWQYDYTLQEPFASPQPLPPDAFAFRIQYTGGAPNTPSNIRVPFQLSL